MPVGGAALAVRYIAFTIVATVVNLAVQRLVLDVAGESLAFYFALFAGTVAGLVVKYALDKRWIFADRSSGVAAHGRKFTIYTLMGVVTTVIFWGTETLFWLYWQTHAAREIGAILGLAVGYAVKYRLDRRFVFANDGAGRPA
jgi:putative flippase GtrA